MTMADPRWAGHLDAADGGQASPHEARRRDQSDGDGGGEHGDGGLDGERVGGGRRQRNDAVQVRLGRAADVAAVGGRGEVVGQRLQVGGDVLGRRGGGRGRSRRRRGRESARRRTDFSAAPQSQVNGAGGREILGRLGDEGRERVNINRGEGVPGQQGGVFGSEERNVAGRVARRPVPPPVGQARHGPAAWEGEESVAEVQEVHGEDAREHRHRAADGRVLGRVLGLAREIGHFQGVRVDGDVPQVGQGGGGPDVVGVAMGQQDGLGPGALRRSAPAPPPGCGPQCRGCRRR